MLRADNLTTFVFTIVLKSGSLSLLETSGLVQGRTAIALALHSTGCFRRQFLCRV